MSRVVCNEGFVGLLALVLCAPVFAAAPELVVEIAAGDPGGAIAHVTLYGGQLYFSADDGTGSAQLWRSDGTQAGTTLVADLGEEAAGTLNDFTVAVSLLFFTADNVDTGKELWCSDGSEAGTALVKDIRAGGDATPRDLIAYNGRIFFSADDGVTGRELWSSDGTEAGTILLADLNPDGGSYPQHAAVYNGHLYFSASDDTNGQELWRTDGTEAGTTLVKDIYPGAHSNPQFLTVANNLLFFSAVDDTSGLELWRTDGTEAGTLRVKDIHESGSSFPVFLAPVGAELYFSAVDGVNGRELWKSDGTETGTVLVCDGEPGPFGSFPQDITAATGGLYFSAATLAADRELWWSDGTAAGTRMVRDIRSPGTSEPGPFNFINGLLYFQATDQPAGSEIWVSNGTEGGTVLFADINPGNQYSSPAECITMNGRLYFTADDGVNGRELWAFDLPDEDLTPPIITVLGTNPLTIEQTTIYVDQGATAVDNFDGNVTADIATVNMVSTATPATYIVTYSVSDMAGNDAVATRTVNVLPTEAPVITLIDDAEIDVEVGSTFDDPGATATDNVDGDLTESIVITGTVDTGIFGDYTLHYNLSDAAGNAAIEVTRLVHVVDSIAPIITILGATEILVEAGQPYADEGATAFDNYDGDLTSSLATVNPVDINVPDTYVVQYTVADSSGNVGQSNRTVHVLPNEAPVVTLLGDNPLEVLLGTPFVDPGFTAIDNVDGDVSGAVVVEGEVNVSTIGTYLRTYTVADAAGNSASVERTVEVVPPAGVFLSIGAPSPTLTVRGPIVYTVTYTNAETILLDDTLVEVVALSGDATGEVHVAINGTASATVTVDTITGEGILAITILAGSAIGLDQSLAPALGPSLGVTVLLDADGDGIATDLEDLLGTDPLDPNDRPDFWAFIIAFDAQGGPLYESVGDYFMTGDIDHDILPDRLETALVAYILSQVDYPLNAVAQDHFLGHIIELQTEPSPAVAGSELVLAALEMVGDELAGYWRDTLDLEGVYSVFGANKSITEPLTGLGDFDGDHLSNEEEYQNVIAHNGGLLEYIEAVTKASRSGEALPATDWPILLLLGAFLAYVAKRRLS